jgi:hypothetical protein
VPYCWVFCSARAAVDKACRVFSAHRLLREHFVKGKSIKQLVRELKRLYLAMSSYEKRSRTSPNLVLHRPLLAFDAREYLPLSTRRGSQVRN